MTFESKLESLDISLFEKIESQTTDNDKKSLLAIQHAIRKEPYVYLEIGSHLGGSIQPFLLDPKCTKIFSIDKRPLVQADNRREEGCAYPDNSTQRMLDNLKKISDVSKITCFDSDASDIDKSLITPKPDLCFIDGEHTDTAVISDYSFCKTVSKGIIVFHDCAILFKGLYEIMKKLEKKQKFRAYLLSDYILVLELGEQTLLKDPKIIQLLGENYQGYFAGMDFVYKGGLP